MRFSPSSQAVTLGLAAVAAVLAARVVSACGSYGPTSCAAFGSSAFCSRESPAPECVCDCCGASNTCDQLLTSGCRKDIWQYDLVFKDSSTGAVAIQPNTTLSLTVGQSVDYTLYDVNSSPSFDVADPSRSSAPCIAPQLANHGLTVAVSGNRFTLKGVAKTASTDNALIVFNSGSAGGLHALPFSLVISSGGGGSGIGGSGAGCSLKDSAAPYAIPTDSSGNPILVSFADAQKYCSSTQGYFQLAPETDGNRDLLSRLVSTCAPSLSKAWISAFNGDTYSGYPLFTMKRTDGTAGYGVYVDVTFTEKMPMICTTGQKL
ncbi:hypothetical protein DFJ73DRAFT_802344 [Zopfochytrium polystomum]|nr:hypothetical protein DFJ73DRAFT_802344 [Zopfochytrium polystomum]